MAHTRLLTYLPPCIGVICPWGVEAGVGGFRSPGTSAIELLPVDWGVCGPCKDPELADNNKYQEKNGEKTRGYQIRSALLVINTKKEKTPSY